MPGGAGLHGAERGGLAALTSSLMDEGTTTRSSEALALAAERMGTSLTTNSGWDGSYVGMQCLRPYLAQSLDLAVDVLLNPTFPEVEFNRIKGQVLAALESERDSGENRAYRAMIRALYGSNHPYRLPVDGELASIENLSRADLIAFHQRAHTSARAAWVVAGDVEPDAVAEMLDDRLGDWSSNPRDLPVFSQPEASIPGIFLLNKPGAAQAVVRVGHVGTNRLSEDYSALAILNQILGGQFTSRLNARLREEKGFTYGIRSQFDFRRGPGPFAITASIQSDKVGEALRDIKGEVEALLDHRPPTVEEIDDAKRALIEGQARQFETPASLASRYGGLLLYGFEPDYHAKFAERLEEVSQSDLQAVAARYLRPSEMIAVVVADADSVRDDLERK